MQRRVLITYLDAVKLGRNLELGIVRVKFEWTSRCRIAQPRWSRFRKRCTEHLLQRLAHRVLTRARIVVDPVVGDRAECVPRVPALHARRTLQPLLTI